MKKCYLIWPLLLPACGKPAAPVPRATLDLVQSVDLEPSPEGEVLAVTSAQIHQDRLYLSDIVYTRGVFCYDFTGKLRCKVGRTGQGPGEYAFAGGVAGDAHRILVGGGNKTLYLYDAHGASTGKVSIPWLKEPTSMVLWGDTVYGTAFSRYVPQSIHQIDLKTGEVVRAFSESDAAYRALFDNYHPYGGLFADGDTLVQFFNHRYELLYWSPEGTLLRKVVLKSPHYRPPNYKKEVAAKEERAFRETFTLFAAAYPYGNGGLVTVLQQKTGDKDYEERLELWDEAHTLVGSIPLASGETLLGVHDGRLVFFTAEGEVSRLLLKVPTIQNGR